MKAVFFIFLGIFTLQSCFSKPPVDPSTLPKDISTMPIPEKDSVNANHPIVKDSTDTKALEENIRDLRKEIIQLSESKICENAADWRISPLGAKPCGGPRTYIAYPKDLENVLLPKISKFNAASADYNRKKGLTSDCAIVPIPSGIHCENGKPILDYK